ncbi:hypothetical protein EIP86_006947 [Pleurotus ostreatoroseus]|nr:hypothetical protein EIP86_006947 [Pleurotus ostreatoroseus]
MSPRVWFSAFDASADNASPTNGFYTVTGTSSGFGRVATEHALAQGDVVVATLRKPEALDDLKAKYAADKLLVLRLDVTIAKEIADAFQKAIDVFGRIDVVFNNAGYSVFAEVEGTTNEVARALFNTNFFGAMDVSREAVRVFRDVNRPIGGRLLITSSMAGIGPIPRMGYYVSTKHALEGGTKTLVSELDSAWNIKVTLIEAGSFETSICGKSVVAPLHPAYTEPTLPSVVARTLLTDPTGPKVSWNNTNKGVAEIYRLTTLDDPPLHFPLGKDALGLIRNQIEVLTNDMERYESWSADLRELCVPE